MSLLQESAKSIPMWAGRVDEPLVTFQFISSATLILSTGHLITDALVRLPSVALSVLVTISTPIWLPLVIMSQLSFLILNALTQSLHPMKVGSLLK